MRTRIATSVIGGVALLACVATALVLEEQDGGGLGLASDSSGLSSDGGSDGGNGPVVGGDGGGGGDSDIERQAELVAKFRREIPLPPGATRFTPEYGVPEHDYYQLPGEDAEMLAARDRFITDLEALGYTWKDVASGNLWRGQVFADDLFVASVYAGVTQPFEGPAYVEIEVSYP